MYLLFLSVAFFFVLAKMSIYSKCSVALLSQKQSENMHEVDELFTQQPALVIGFPGDPLSRDISC